MTAIPPLHCARGRAHLLQAPARFISDSRGVTAIEFGMVAMPFFAITFAIIETALVFFAGQLLETAVAIASREIRTGRVQSMNWTKQDFATEVCQQIPVLISCRSGDPDLFVDVNTFQSFATVADTYPVDADGNYTQAQSFVPGGSSQIVVVRVYYKYQLLVNGFGLDLADLPGQKRLLSAVATFRNEPF